MKFNRRRILMCSSALLLAGCKPARQIHLANPIYDIYSERFSELVDISVDFEVLGTGYYWSEGPVWDTARRRLYFTDVPKNIAYSWDKTGGVQTFLNPSGSAGAPHEGGANGLLIGQSGDLLICNHGGRSVDRLNLDSGERTVLTGFFDGRPFNSPNDLIQGANGEIYFTDPPYGFDKQDESPLKKLKSNGVYVLSANGAVERLIDDLTRPNGIGLSPDGNILYVAQSDSQAQHIYALDLTEPNATKTLLVDLTPFAADDMPGLPDGFAVDHRGNLFATGPGGVFVITPTGEILGRIKTGKASANCAFGEDGSTLFITNHDRLIKIKTLTRGLAWA